jgi:hypothetical protein
MKKYLLIGGGIVAIALGIIFSPKAEANSSFFLPVCSTATLTSSPNYLTAGTATTTLSCDSYQNGIPRATDSISLLIQQAASSTSSVLNINIQYSQDNVDWYETTGMASPIISTTTNPINLSTVGQFQLKFASSTIDLSAVTSVNSATTTRFMSVNTPLRYVRAIFSAPASSAGQAIWAQFIPKRETTN